MCVRPLWAVLQINKAIIDFMTYCIIMMYDVVRYLISYIMSFPGILSINSLLCDFEKNVCLSYRLYIRI